MFVLTKKTQYTCTAIVMLYFVQTTVGYQTQLCWSRGHGAVVAVCWPGFNLHCEQFLFLFFPFFLELSFYDTKDTVKSKVLLCKISKELSPPLFYFLFFSSLYLYKLQVLFQKMYQRLETKVISQKITAEPFATQCTGSTQ